MTAPVKQVSFANGEVTPAAYARTDNALYEKSLRTLRNMVVMRHGGVTGRPGTMYVGTALNSGNAVRLIPFIFNETGNGQSYMLEFGNLYVAVYQNGNNVVSSTKTITGVTNANPCVIASATHGFSNGDVVLITGVLGMTNLDNNYYIVANSAANTFSLTDLLGNAIDSTLFPAYTSGGTASKIYKIVSPYAQADLATLKYAECADIITITHPTYAVYELKRLGALNWTLTTATFGPTIGSPTVSPPTGSAGAVGIIYYVSAVTATGEEGEAASSGGITLAAASSAAPITVTWTAVTGATSYRIYKGPSGSSYGYMGTVTGLTYVDTGVTPDFTNSIVLPFAPFVGAGNYPSAVGFSQQRRFFASTNNNPVGFWGSQPGDFYNFDSHIFTNDSDAIVGSLAGEEVNTIQHLLELKFMLMLTSGAEIYVQGDGTGVVKPSAINASVQSQYGSSSLKPLKVGDVLLFNQALGSFVRDFAFDFSIDGYRGNDITVFAAHLFEGFSLADWAYQKIPDSIVWAARSDGTLLSCTYVREQQVLGWARHDFTNGTVENVCAIPENGAYSVYLSIKRVINGATVRYIERLSSRIWSDVLNATYLDSFSSYNGVNAGATTMTLTASGAFLTGGTAYQQSLTLTASAGFFTAAMVGDQIFLSDAAFVSAMGNMVDPENPGSANVLPTSGNQIRCTIQAYSSSTVVTVTPSGAVPLTMQNVALLTWAHAVTSVSGLGYLAGQQVSVWADRFVVGSPLNYHISTVYTVPASGVLTLDKAYSVIYIGLPMVQDFETLDLETSFGEMTLASRKRAAKLAIYLLKTRTLFAGSENPAGNLNNKNQQALYQLNELKVGTYQTTYDQAPELMTEQEYVLLESRFNKNGRLFIRNVDPAPLTILAVSPEGESKAPMPYYQRV